MKPLALLTSLCLLATACAGTKAISLPTGESGFRVSCGAPLGIGKAGGKSGCYKRAAEICPQGYEVVDPETGSGPAAPQPKSFAVPGSSGIAKAPYKFEMTVRCEHP